MKSTKKLLFLIICIVCSKAGYGLDWAFQVYLPSLFNFASGFYQFTENSADERERYIQSLEFKFLVGKAGPVAFSTNGITSLYIGDGNFSSFNMSLGLGISHARSDKSPLQGLYLTLYPVYEFPLITLGKMPLSDWKAAIDIGIAIGIDFNFNTLLRTALYLSLYGRMICFWKDKVYPLGAVPDFGFAVGFHFQEKIYRTYLKRY